MKIGATLFGSFRYLINSKMRIVLIPIFITYLFMLLYGFFFSDTQIFFPQPASYSDSPGIIKLKPADGIQISAAYLPAKDARYVILYNHGNAEDIGDLMPLMGSFRDHGFSVFVYDYEGYGTSGGYPSEKKVYRDAEAAYRYLVNDLKIDPAKVIVFGRSIGSGAAVHLALKEKVAGLIIESGCISAFRVRTVVPLVPFDKFNNIAKIDRIHCPVLVIHGKEDRTIPFWHGKALYKKANMPKMYYWVDGASHDDVFLAAGDNYWKTLGDFVRLNQELP